ncbi:MAG TPA: FCSD flavin-binding domain-containing protein [Burkholderiales bacterium]|nr:FCSD flavin-binding domain-containing protein [Burkholderiales bacterium]
MWQRPGSQVRSHVGPEGHVIVVERDAQFISCPLSNRVRSGQVDLVDLTRGYGPLSSRHSIGLMHDQVVSIDPDKQAIHLASVHRYDPEKKTMIVAAGASGVSAIPSELEGGYAQSWGKNIWAVMLA